METVHDGLLNGESICHGQEGVGQRVFSAVAWLAAVLCRRGALRPCPGRDA